MKCSVKITVTFDKVKQKLKIRQFNEKAVGATRKEMHDVLILKPNNKNLSRFWENLFRFAYRAYS